MNYYAAIDVSLECSSVCVVDGTGRIVRERMDYGPMQGGPGSFPSRG